MEDDKKLQFKELLEQRHTEILELLDRIKSAKEEGYNITSLSYLATRIQKEAQGINSILKNLEEDERWWSLA